MMGLLPVTVILLLLLCYYFHWLKDNSIFIFTLSILKWQIAFSRLANKLSTGVLDRPKSSQTYCKTFTEEPDPDPDNIGTILN